MNDFNNTSVGFQFCQVKISSRISINRTQISSQHKQLSCWIAVNKCIIKNPTQVTARRANLCYNHSFREQQTPSDLVNLSLSSELKIFKCKTSIGFYGMEVANTVYDEIDPKKGDQKTITRLASAQSNSVPSVHCF